MKSRVEPVNLNRAVLKTCLCAYIMSDNSRVDMWLIAMSLIREYATRPYAVGEGTVMGGGTISTTFKQPRS
jgi:hypothetical protein